LRRILPRGSVMERAHPQLFKGIPKCPDCGTNAVRLLAGWVCPDCFDMGGGESLAAVLPNRAARRRAR